MTQRWRRGRDSYRPKGEPIDTSKFGVELIEERVAKEFVRTHHYSRTYPAARLRAGLFRAGEGLVGVAVFSQPMNKRTIGRFADVLDGVELGRFVLLDDVPANGETWFLARAFRLLKREKPQAGVAISYADPLPRANEDGVVIKPGHFGTIYQAFNAQYFGRARAENLVLDAAGRVISRRSLSKIRNDEKGAAYAYEQLRAAGAPARRSLEDGKKYVERALTCGAFRRLKHPGNLSYAWPLHRGVSLLPEPQPYPKEDQHEVRA
jgi:hypothetical protein